MTGQKGWPKAGLSPTNPGLKPEKLQTTLGLLKQIPFAHTNSEMDPFIPNAG